jgi:polyisoprenyl-teichoic acid--peptidoglycan teichoic acid transferase
MTEEPIWRQSGTGTAPPPAPRKPRGRRALLVVGIALAVLLVAGVAVIGYLAQTATQSLSRIPREPNALPANVDRPPVATPTVSGALPAMNIVLIGADDWIPKENGRSDSLMVVHISSDRSKVYIVSFPRDMWVTVPGHGQAKINAAYSWGGTALAVQTLEGLTGAHMDHVVTTNLDDFVGLVNVVGGVTVDNPVPSTAKDPTTGATYTYPKGPVYLDGAMALLFSRQRYELPNGDLDRALRQRALIKALALKVATPQVLANPVVLGNVIRSVAKYVKVDSGMTDSMIIDLATSMRITNGDQIISLQAPITGFGTSADGQAIDLVDSAALTTLGRALQTDAMADYVTSHPK